MFRKKEKEKAQPSVAMQPQSKLTRKQRKAIAEAKQKQHARLKGKGISAQETIPYKHIYSDGIVYLGDGRYSKTLRFDDMTYQLANAEDQKNIFEQWCGILNYFDPTIPFQLTFFNRRTAKSEFIGVYKIDRMNDVNSAICDEYSEYIASQMAKGDNGMKKTKYLTYTVDASSIKRARIAIERIDADVINAFKRLGVTAVPLHGKDRLELLHRILHVGDHNSGFFFDWKMLSASGLDTKDFIAPSSFEFPAGRYCRIGQAYAACSMINITASEISDRMLTDMLNVSSSQVLTMHIRRIDQSKAIKTVKRKLLDIDSVKVSEQKKAVRTGYDMDILPTDLNLYASEARSILHDLQKHDEGLFYVTIVVMTYAATKERLETNIKQLSSLVQQRNCSLVRLDFQQEQGLVASLPLGINELPFKRALPTSSAAIFMPFTTQELCKSDSKKPLYYGLNALTNNIILADRQDLNNPNGLILGTPGSGKSFAAKREMFNVFFTTGDHIRICDPEGEYYPVVEAIGGQVIKIASTSDSFINPLDIHEGYADDDPVSFKSNFVISLCETIVGGVSGLDAVEKTIIDRAVRRIYVPYLADPDPARMPILEDLYNELMRMAGDGSQEAKHIAESLELYVHGSLKLFNNRTNVDLTNRVVCYDVKELGKQLKPLAMLIIQDQIWIDVSRNRDLGITTRYYVDEFHLLLRDPETAAHSVEIFKRFRKWNGIPTGITQNVKDLLSSSEISSILENTDFMLLLNQNGEDRQILAAHKNISPEQLSFVENAGQGEGLLIYGGTIIPFVDRFPKDLMMYRLMTTKPNEAREEDG